MNSFDIENWNAWTSSLISHGQPSIMYSRIQKVEKIPEFIISRFWPQRYEELEFAIFNAKNVLIDLIKVFYTYADDESPERLKDKPMDRRISTRKFYKIREWDTEKYHSLLKEYEYHVALIEDLTFELTRAVNFIIEKIRIFISQKFREEEGKLLITTGPFLDFSWKTFKVEYKIEEKKNPHPYPGLRKIMIERETRDISNGVGFSKIYFFDQMEE